jgi:ribulose kinase
MIVVGCPIILPRESESVLLGAAILGAVAARKYYSLNEAMRALNAAGQVSLQFLNSIIFLYIQDRQ